MLNTETINHIFGVSESYQAPYELDKILKDRDNRKLLFSKFINEESDLSYDWFTNYFQEEQSDRKGKKQDFTPDGIIKIASGLLGKTSSNADICAGTGGLTIKRWLNNKDAYFYCEEFSDRAVPFLIFNLAIRNMNAEIIHGDSLTRKVKHIYKLKCSDNFSEIEEIEKPDKQQFDTVIMNPPYSLPWSADPEYLKQDRFKDYGLAPKGKADFAFLLQGLSELSDNGIMSIILPHGVLFRGAAEEKIRKQLIKNNYLDAVIGLPGKAFLNTDIPTAILVLKKNKQTQDILFIDAQNEYVKQKNYNEITQTNVDRVLKTYQDRKDVDKFAHATSLEEIDKNDFNLNIPRYVDTFEPEPVIPLDKVMADLTELDHKDIYLQQELENMFNELTATTPETQAELDKFRQQFSLHVKAKQEQMSLL